MIKPGKHRTRENKPVQPKRQFSLTYPSASLLQVTMALTSAFLLIHKYINPAAPAMIINTPKTIIATGPGAALV